MSLYANISNTRPQLLIPDLLRGELLSHVRLPAAFTLTALNLHAITIYISSPENFAYTYPNLHVIIISTPGTYLIRLDIPAGSYRWFKP